MRQQQYPSDYGHPPTAACYRSPQMTIAALMTCNTPVFNALLNYSRERIKPFHMPAHKGAYFVPGLEKLLTPAGLSCDLPSMEATDSWNHPAGCIAAAKKNAATLYGAADTFFLVNGATMGNQVMLLSAVPEGGKLLLPRNFHSSVFAAMALGGIIPSYIPSRWLPGVGPVPVTREEVIAAATPDVSALLVTSPTCYGIGRDLSGIAAWCRERKIPLLADEAHGAHLAFLPPGYVQPALLAGADLVVQSLHKTIGSMIGTAQLHLGRHSTISPQRVQHMLNLLQSTSPSNILLSSLELANNWLENSGDKAFEMAVDNICTLREQLDHVEGLQVTDTDSNHHLRGCLSDPLKLAVDVSGLGITGFTMERILKNEFRILCEFSDFNAIVFALGAHDDPYHYLLLKEAMIAVARRLRDNRKGWRHIEKPRTYQLPEMILPPRAAAFADKKPMLLREAVGAVCGEMISVYPPGIPLICPGEKITEEVVGMAAQLQAEAACVHAKDPSLQSVLIIHR